MAYYNPQSYDPNQPQYGYDPNQPQYGYDNNPPMQYGSGNMQFGEFSYGQTPDQQWSGQPNAYGQAMPNMFIPTSSAANLSSAPPTYDDEPPLLEELGINFSHIFQKTQAVLNPFKANDPEVVKDTDLAGPLVFCLMFGGSLLLSGKLHFGYIYGIGLVGCLAVYVLLNMMSAEGVSVTCIMSTLGYCLLPMCVLSAFALLLSLKTIIGILLTGLIVVWCALSSSKLFVTALAMDHQQVLVAYPCALVYGIFALLTVF